MMKEMIEKLKVVCLLLCFTVVFNALAFAQQMPPANDRGTISPAEALSRYEKLLQATADPQEKFHLTTKAAPAALAAGEYEKAKGYANSILQYVDTQNGHEYFGYEIHIGNLVLGLVAIAADDVAEAKRCLLEAGKTPGSPTLNTFGPNMRLAKELLARGEKEVVIQYFDLCAEFWEMHEDRLDAWKAVVIKGGIPDFRANLVYGLDDWKFENWAKQ